MRQRAAPAVHTECATLPAAGDPDPTITAHLPLYKGDGSVRQEVVDGSSTVPGAGRCATVLPEEPKWLASRAPGWQDGPIAARTWEVPA